MYAAGSDFTSSPTVVTFLPGETSAQVQVPITDDSILEGTEVFTATLSTTDPDVVFGDDTAFVTILDNNGMFVCHINIFLSPDIFCIVVPFCFLSSSCSVY